MSVEANVMLVGDIFADDTGETAASAIISPMDTRRVKDRRYIEQPLRSPQTIITNRTLVSSNVNRNETSSSSQTTVNHNSLSTSSSDKKTMKKYGSKLGDNKSSPSRSRSATKELILPPDDSMCPPEFTQKLTDRKVNDGEPLELTCFIKGDPDPQVTWLKDGKTLRSSDVVDLKYRNGLATLNIAEVFPEDEGEYVCRASNSLGTVESKCRLAVTPLPNTTVPLKPGEKDKPPRIVSHLQSDFVKDGDPVVLSVRIIGAQKFDVIWLHNNKEIKPSKDFQYTNTANIYKLNIAEIFPEDSGVYTCEAFNDSGESFSSCTLTVLVPNEDPKSPVFKTFPRSTTVQEGERIEFDCEFKSAPSKVTWYKDGTPIEEGSSKYEFVQDGKKFRLKILSSTSLDMGQYIVKATDKTGESSAAFSVNVYSSSEV